MLIGDLKSCGLYHPNRIGPERSIGTIVDEAGCLQNMLLGGGSLLVYIAMVSHVL